MAKRFTDTNKYRDTWFRKLEPKYKIFWDYLYHECNHAGIWDPDFGMAEFMIGENYTEKEVLSVLNDRVVILKSGKWFIPKFILFQYGELNNLNRVHSSVISILKKEGACKGLASPKLGCKDKYKDKDKDKEKDKDKIKHFEVVFLTKSEYQKLIDKFGQKEADRKIENLNDGIMSKGYKYKSHYHTILNWERRNGKDNGSGPKSGVRTPRQKELDSLGNEA